MLKEESSNIIGIVILNYNTGEECVDLINSLYVHEERLFSQKRCHIYLIDNGSKNNDAAELENHYKNNSDITVIRNETNLGFSAGNNVGISKAIDEGCEYVFVLNSDLLLINEAISKMASVFENYVDVGFVSPAIYDMQNNLNIGFTKAPSIKSLITNSHFVPAFLRNDNNEAIKLNEKSRTGIVTYKDSIGNTCCFGLRKTFIQQAHCMDGNIFLYGEEYILAAQVRDSEFKSAVCFDSKVYHLRGVAVGRVCNNEIYSFLRQYCWPSNIYIFRRYGHFNKLFIYTLKLIYDFYWKILSIKHSEYVNHTVTYMQEMRRILSVLNDLKLM